MAMDTTAGSPPGGGSADQDPDARNTTQKTRDTTEINEKSVSCKSWPQFIPGLDSGPRWDKRDTASRSVLLEAAQPERPGGTRRDTAGDPAHRQAANDPKENARLFDLRRVS